MSFARSDAVSPTGDLTEIQGWDYETQCAALCIGPHPSWREVLSRFAQVRDRL